MALVRRVFRRDGKRLEHTVELAGPVARRGPAARRAHPQHEDAADVRALLGLAAKSLDARRCFEDATPKEPAVRKLHLVAMVTFKDNHYTAFVKDKHGHWTWHDKAEATACRGWKDVVDRCCKTKGAPMLPYLLLYDNPVEVPPAAR